MIGLSPSERSQVEDPANIPESKRKVIPSATDGIESRAASEGNRGGPREGIRTNHHGTAYDVEHSTDR
jgi:hypothetical protein